jgi:hypothetical protein
VNLRGILRRVGRLENAAPPAMQFFIPKKSGMAGLRAAIAAARADREARGDAKYEPPAGVPLPPVMALTRAILDDQARRAAIGPPVDYPAVYDDEPIEEPSQCTVTTPNSNP